jgi:hypothetical protein
MRLLFNTYQNKTLPKAPCAHMEVLYKGLSYECCKIVTLVIKNMLIRYIPDDIRIFAS